MKHILTVLFFGLSIFVRADELDSLVQANQSSPGNAITLNALSSFFADSLPELSKTHALQALEISEKKSLKEEQAKAYINLGNYYYNNSQLDSSIQAFQSATLSLKNTDYYEQLSNGFSNLGTIYYYKGLYDMAIEAFIEAAKFEELNNHPEEMAVIFNNIAAVYYYTGKYADAIDYNNKSLEIKRELNSTKGIANSLNNIANIYESIGDYYKAMEYYVQALKYSDTIQDLNLKSTVLNNIAGVYKTWKEYDKSLELYKQSLEIKQQSGNKSGEANVYNNIGLIYFLKNDAVKALANYSKAEEIYTSIGDQYGLSVTYNNIGSLKEHFNLFNEARQYYNMAVDKCDIMNNPSGKAKELVNLGRIYYEMNENKEAEISLNHALQIAEEVKNISISKDAHELLSKLFERIHKNELAFKHFKAYSELKDSIFNSEKQKSIMELNAKYETDKKQQIINNLAQRQLLTKNELEIRDLRLKQNFWMILGLILIILVGGLSFLFIYRQKALKSKQQEIELEQKLLRSQMNPHFISNALNSIQQYVLSNQAIEAAKYLSRFTQLMRNIILNSRNEAVKIETEIETLENYMLLQQMRFKEKFDFKIEIDKDIDQEHDKVPPMLAQPIIENALQHGFKNIDYKGLIELQFTIENNNIILTIKDNGIGLKAGQKNNDNHISYARKIIEERITNLNKKSKTTLSYELKDRIEIEQISGTICKFVLPLSY
ncbi:MAG: tetratricopeptide repeat protein [Bacteroidales bacterium]|nr:tetratricopeptide repeat protein [Bacteroidales bacterium]